MTGRVAAIVGGLLLLAAGVLVQPPPSGREGEGLAPLGRSLGGAGVLAVDALFARADALRRAGRVAEVPALYRAALELDPDNPIAADFLVSVLAVDLLNDAPDARERALWWREAWDLLERARRRHPDDASLAMRGADLLLEVPARHPELEEAVAEAIPDARRVGLDLLLEAARLTPTLPRRGRQHLDWLAFLLPVVAAEQGPGPARDATLEAGRALLEQRRETLDEVLTLAEGTGDGPRTLPLARLLEVSLAALGAFDAAEKAGNRAAAADAVAGLAEALPGLPLVDALRHRLELLR